LVGSVARAPFPSGVVTLRVETDYPWDGTVNLAIGTASCARFTLHVRKPGWCQRAEVKLNGAVDAVRPDDAGYWSFEREWKDGDSVKLILEMPVELMVAHPNIVSCRGKVAIQRGPLVYGFEGIDNGGKPPARLGSDVRFAVERRPDLLGGVTVIQSLAANGPPIRAIPYYALGNRGKSAQEVWVEQQDLKPAVDWWLGALYRPAPPK